MSLLVRSSPQLRSPIPSESGGELSLPVSAGAYALTGQDVGFELGTAGGELTLPVSAGAYALTGKDVGFVLGTVGDWAIDIEPGIFYSINCPSSGNGVPSGKHLSITHCPADGRLYWHGGDYQGPVYNQSYRQEVWALDLATWWNAGGGNAAGWELMHTYNGYGGSSVQPKHPDYAPLVWHPTQETFWFVPGTMVGDGLDQAPGETASLSSDANFIWFKMMKFDPTVAAASRWTDTNINPYPAGVNASAVNDATWFSVYDASNNRLVRWRFDGTYGAVVELFSFATETWAGPYGYPSPLDLAHIGKEYVAHDTVSGWVYVADGIRHKLMRFHAGSLDLEDLGALPYTEASPFPIENYKYVVWDSVNSVVLHFESFSRTFHVYNPATTSWTSPTIVNSPTNGVLMGARNHVFDPDNNVYLVTGGVDAQTDTKFHLYRHGG